MRPVSTGNSATYARHLQDRRRHGFAARNKGEVLSCDNYQRRAWNDFVENQIAPFGNVPFYVGIGNHEVIPPKSEDGFKRHFFDWLNLPALQQHRQLDREPLLPEAYFHWIQGGVDFIYLDNASISSLTTSRPG
jgi:hypothetical protein